MPMHDWTRVKAGMFHDFHGEWLYAVKHALNGGLLPGEYYAMVDQKVSGAIGIGPDILTLGPVTAEPVGKRPRSRGTTPVATLTATDKSPRNADPRRRLLVRHVSGHEIVSLIELVSPGNKHDADSFSAFVEKLATAMEEGLHLTVIDPFPPTPRDPAGVHAALWQRLRNQPITRSPEGRPLVAAGFDVGLRRLRAFVEPFAVNERVPDVPLFLHDGVYVMLPLEDTYTRAFAEFPKLWRDVLEATP